MVDHFDFKFDLIFLDCGIPTDIVQILKIYLGKKFARIKWNDHKGDYKVLNKGVEQGEILPPFFKLYIDDILSVLNNNNGGCIFGLTRVAIVAYDDDMVLLADSHSDLNDIFSWFSSKLKELELKLNKMFNI